MKRAVAAFVAVIMIICTSGCGIFVNERLPRETANYMVVTSWNEKYNLTLSDNSVDKSSLSLKIENESGRLIQTSLDYDEGWFAGYSALVKDYSDGDVKAIKFKWGIVLETADDFSAVMTSEYSDKLRNDELFAKVYDFLSGKYYRYGFNCNTVLQEDYDSAKSLCKEYFENNEPTQEWNSIWADLFKDFRCYASKIRVFGGTVRYDVTNSEKFNGFLEHYSKKIEKMIDEGTFANDNADELSERKKFPMKDKGYNIENFAFDIDSAFVMNNYASDYASSLSIYMSEDFDKDKFLGEVFGNDSDSVIKKMITRSKLCVPVYYEDEFCGYIMLIKYSNNTEPHLRFMWNFKCDDIVKFVSMIKSKDSLVKWCESLGIDGVKDIYIGTATSNHGSEKRGFLAYIVTDDEEYVYLNNVVGLSALNGKAVTPDEFVKNYYDDFLNGLDELAKYYVEPETG